jgi:hypothetical protein
VDLDCIITCAVSDIVLDGEHCHSAVRRCFPERTTETSVEITYSSTTVSDETVEDINSPTGVSAAIAEDKLGISGGVDAESAVEDTVVVTGPRRDALERLFDTLTVPLICNCFILSSALNGIHKLSEGQGQREPGVTGVGSNGPKEVWSVQELLHVAEQLSRRAEEARELLRHAKDVAEALSCVQSFAGLCRDQTQAMWASMSSLLPRLMPAICSNVRKCYLHAHHAFTRMQVLVHVCR